MTDQQSDQLKAQMSNKVAWCTLLTNTNYLPGCLVLAESLKRVDSKFSLVVMHLPDMDESTKKTLQTMSNIQLHKVDYLLPKNLSNANYAWSQYADTWTKMRVWELIEFDKLVLLDSDMLVCHNMDELITDVDVDVGWVAGCHACTCNPMNIKTYPPSWTPDSCAYTQYAPNPCPPTDKRAYFNSGLLVLRPSTSTWIEIEKKLDQISEHSSYKFPDQDLLNEVFLGKWKSLGYGYNALKTLKFCHSSLWYENEEEIKNSNNKENSMIVKNIHYILEKAWDVHDLEKAKKDGNKFVDNYKWWWLVWWDVERNLAERGFTVKILPKNK